MRCGRAIAAALLLLVFALARPAIAQTLQEVTAGAVWSESDSDLLRRFGRAATVLPRPLDFGDSFADIALRYVALGDYRMIAYFQMDKATGRLKRIQFERPRHAVNPPVFRAAAQALEAAYGTPDRLCGVAPGPASGYQRAAERIWVGNGRVIRAIFRDTTTEAFEGCIGTVGPCGLTGQLLVRISPPGADASDCPVPPGRHGRD